jgi:hypothetical protein
VVVPPLKSTKRAHRRRPHRALKSSSRPGTLDAPARLAAGPVNLIHLSKRGSTIAHHAYTEDGRRIMMVAWLRYLDTVTKVDQTWLIAARQIILEGSETRSLG